MNGDHLAGRLPECPTCGHDELRPQETVYSDAEQGLGDADDKTAAESVKDVSAECGYCGAGVGLDVRTRIEAQQVSAPADAYQEGRA